MRLGRLILGLIPLALAFDAPPALHLFPVDPAGPCAAPALALNINTAAVSRCVDGAWTAAAPGTGVPIVSALPPACAPAAIPPLVLLAAPDPALYACTARDTWTPAGPSCSPCRCLPVPGRSGRGRRRQLRNPVAGRVPGRAPFPACCCAAVALPSAARPLREWSNNSAVTPSASPAGTSPSTAAVWKGKARLTPAAWPWSRERAAFCSATPLSRMPPALPWRSTPPATSPFPAARSKAISAAPSSRRTGSTASTFFSNIIDSAVPNLWPGIGTIGIHT